MENNMEEKKISDIELIVKYLKQFYPWVDEIITSKKRIHRYPENQTYTVDVIQIYVKYNNDDYLKLEKSPQELKNKFYDFLGRYFNNDPRNPDSTISIEFYELVPVRI